MANDQKLYIRLPKELKDEFLRVCTEQDLKQSQVLRKCMREYIKNNKEVPKSQEK